MNHAWFSTLTWVGLKRGRKPSIVTAHGQVQHGLNPLVAHPRLKGSGRLWYPRTILCFHDTQRLSGTVNCRRKPVPRQLVSSNRKFVAEPIPRALRRDLETDSRLCPAIQPVAFALAYFHLETDKP